MQLYPILLVAIIAMADGGMALEKGVLPGEAATALAAVAPIAIIVATGWGAVALALRLAERRARVALLAARTMTAARWAIIVHFAVSVLLLGWLEHVRHVVGDLVLVDEVVALLPSLLGLIGLWWAYYPIERRLREAVLVRRLDAGQPVYPTPSRGAYVLMQTRSGLLLLLVPVLLIFAVAEAINRAAGVSAGAAPPWSVEVSKYVAALGVFALAPFIARLILAVRPLAAGETRAALLEVCARHNVRVRDILVWDTAGTMINAAVMGLIGPLRYVLLTDALLESMDADEVEAVMAHEVAHVRRHHMPWMVVALMAALLLGVLTLNLPLLALGVAGVVPQSWVLPMWLEVVLLVLELAVALVVFGWVSRRFERQADSFAVQHLSGMGRPELHGAATISPRAVGAMSAALERIAHLNALDPHQRSWRHGSIAWRQAYLASIIGRPLADLAIDRVVRRIKLAAGLVVAAAIALQVAVHSLPAADPAMPDNNLPFP